MSDRLPAKIDKANTDDTASVVTTQPVPAKSARPRPSRSRHILPYNIEVVIDTREQKPFEFPPEIKTVTATLATGDYSVKGFTPFVAVERKSWADLYSCCGSNHRRFSEELRRMSTMPYTDVVVENDMEYFYSTYMIPQPNGKLLRAALAPKSLRLMLATWHRKYPTIGWWFPGSRIRAMKWTLLLLTSAAQTLLREQKEKQ